MFNLRGIKISRTGKEKTPPKTMEVLQAAAGGCDHLKGVYIY